METMRQKQKLIVVSVKRISRKAKLEVFEFQASEEVSNEKLEWAKLFSALFRSFRAYWVSYINYMANIWIFAYEDVVVFVCAPLLLIPLTLTLKI